MYRYSTGGDFWKWRGEEEEEAGNVLLRRAEGRLRGGWFDGLGCLRMGCSIDGIVLQTGFR